MRALENSISMEETIAEHGRGHMAAPAVLYHEVL